jgi:glucose-1-phosphate thymidylyltransferase
MKAIILAGGTGSRLWPATTVVSKQLLTIYDKPMIYYPLGFLMQLGIRQFLIISTPKDIPLYQNLFANSDRIGLHIEYQVQNQPQGLPEAFILGAPFIQNEQNVVLILGDNFFYGASFIKQLQQQLSHHTQGALIFAHRVPNPEHYGVVEWDDSGKARRLLEKPSPSPSPYAIPGLYIYDASVLQKAKQLKPSARGELEITDLNMLYLQENALHVQKTDTETVWFDMGTAPQMLAASQFVSQIENHTQHKMACLEEIAAKMGWISCSQLKKLGQALAKSPYGQYLIQAADHV